MTPSKSGALFAPFRSRSANPDGFDSKMKLWITVIEEWVIENKKLTISVKDIHQRFVSDTGSRPDKECIRLVLSEMKRRSKVVPLSTVKTSRLWSPQASSSIHPFVDHYIDPKGWLSWGVKNFVYNPASWAVSALTNSDNEYYSDLTDMSILDETKLVCQKSLQELSRQLLEELIRISKAEKQACFEWQHLLELITPILNTIIDSVDSRELLEALDLLIEYLACTKRVALQVDNDTKLIKIADTSDDSRDDEVKITKKDVAMARLLRAKELLTADADRYHNQALRAKQDALNCYQRKELAKAKSLLRSHKRFNACAEQKEAQLANVEILLDQLDNTDSNMMIIQAYKDGAEALKAANTQIESNTSILDDVLDVTAENHHLNEELSQMLNEITHISRPADCTADLEAELQGLIAKSTETSSANKDLNRNPPEPSKTDHLSKDPAVSIQADPTLEDLEARLSSLVVCRDPLPDEIDPSERMDPSTSYVRKAQSEAT